MGDKKNMNKYIQREGEGKLYCRSRMKHLSLSVSQYVLFLLSQKTNCNTEDKSKYKTFTFVLSPKIIFILYVFINSLGGGEGAIKLCKLYLYIYCIFIHSIIYFCDICTGYFRKVYRSLQVLVPHNILTYLSHQSFYQSNSQKKLYYV